jgi:hypothetical protein
LNLLLNLDGAFAGVLPRQAEIHSWSIKKMAQSRMRDP